MLFIESCVEIPPTTTSERCIRKHDALLEKWNASFGTNISERCVTRLSLGVFGEPINSVAGRKRGRACVKADIDELNSTFGDIVHDAQRPYILPVPEGPASASSFCSFEPVTSHDVLLLLQSVDINKATGSDDIPGIVLKSCASALAPSLTLIFNVVLKSGTIPALYKRSNVSPLFKSGDCHKPSNYRPVSLLPIVSRLLEKIVQSQLMSYFISSRSLALQPICI